MYKKISISHNFSKLSECGFKKFSDPKKASDNIYSPYLESYFESKVYNTKWLDFDVGSNVHIFDLSNPEDSIEKVCEVINSFLDDDIKILEAPELKSIASGMRKSFEDLKKGGHYKFLGVTKSVEENIEKFHASQNKKDCIDAFRDIVKGLKDVTGSDGKEVISSECVIIYKTNFEKYYQALNVAKWSFYSENFTDLFTSEIIKSKEIFPYPILPNEITMGHNLRSLTSFNPVHLGLHLPKNYLNVIIGPCFPMSIFNETTFSERLRWSASGLSGQYWSFSLFQQIGLENKDDYFNFIKLIIKSVNNIYGYCADFSNFLEDNKYILDSKRQMKFSINIKQIFDDLDIMGRYIYDDHRQNKAFSILDKLANTVSILRSKKQNKKEETRLFKYFLSKDMKDKMKKIFQDDELKVSKLGTMIDYSHNEIMRSTSSFFLEKEWFRDENYFNKKINEPFSSKEDIIRSIRNFRSHGVESDALFYLGISGEPIKLSPYINNYVYLICLAFFLNPEVFLKND